MCKRNNIYVWISGYMCLCVNPPVQSPTILKWMPNASLFAVGHYKELKVTMKHSNTHSNYQLLGSTRQHAAT